MKLRWFLSAKVRHATDACRHVRRLLNAQRDILSAQAVEALDAAVANAQNAIDFGADDVVAKSVTELETAADKWIKPYPHTEWRENVEVFLVAIVVAMGVRTFFLQPFKIPTGSMQPTLFGVTIEDLHDNKDFQMPNPFMRLYDAVVFGKIYHEIIAPADCRFAGLGEMKHPLPFLNKQDIIVDYTDGGRQAFTVWCGPDGREDLATQTGAYIRGFFHKGEPIIRFVETAGDHLFVDRVTYNFRPPDRGEIIVFKTKGIPDNFPVLDRTSIPDQNQFYIKRLVGLPTDAVSIGTDRHARINGVPLDASTDHFANIYGFDPKGNAEKDHYSGHVLLPNDPRCLLREPTDAINVRPGHYLVFGDNTLNSLDSRFWGDLPERNVIGKSFFVYWPISPRFGWEAR